MANRRLGQVIPLFPRASKAPKKPKAEEFPKRIRTALDALERLASRHRVLIAGVVLEEGSTGRVVDFATCSDRSSSEDRKTLLFESGLDPAVFDLEDE